MWWSRALVVAVLVSLGPVGCGFRPLYGRPDAALAPASPAVAELAAIRVAGIDNRPGQQLRNALVQRLTPLGEPAAARYLLTVRYSESAEGLAASKDGHATIGRLTVNATFFLSPLDGEKPLFSGHSRAMATYRMLGPRYGTVAIERDAQERALEEMAEDIRGQLAAFFANRPDSR